MLRHSPKINRNSTSNLWHVDLSNFHQSWLSISSPVCFTHPSHEVLTTNKGTDLVRSYLNSDPAKGYWNVGRAIFDLKYYIITERGMPSSFGIPLYYNPAYTDE